MTRPSWAAYAWAAPTSVLGLLAVGVTAPSVRTVDGVLEAHGRRLARLLDLVSPRMCVLAMTLGHVVIGRDAAALDASRAHERVHVRQAELWGPFFVPAYLLASALAWARGGDAYADNPFERAAWSAAPIGPTATTATTVERGAPVAQR